MKRRPLVCMHLLLKFTAWTLLMSATIAMVGFGMIRLCPNSVAIFASRHHGMQWVLPYLNWPEPKIPRAELRNVTYDHRSLIVNGERKILFAGAIHYPRSTPRMWPSLLKKSKVAGIGAIDTYVFWNLHERVEGVVDFEAEGANLLLFLETISKEDLYVVLRIGPYINGAFDYGGLPFWLLDKPGVELRTFNKAYMTAMENFVRNVIEAIRPFLITNGGPIVMLQMENEYGSVETDYGRDGKKYIAWAADLANSLDVGVPWVMCQQDDIPTVINTVNGFYGDDWIFPHFQRFKDQPAMFTELWSGWYQQWKSPKPTRSVEDLSYAATRFVAKGGTYISYYMWHGGTNFGRMASSLVTTSFDYDAPLNEYGFENGNKFGHLRDLHLLCKEYEDMLLGFEPTHYSTGGATEAHVYGKLGKTPRLLAFLSNTHPYESAIVQLYGMEFHLPPKSVSIYVMTPNGLSLRYRTSNPPPALPAVAPSRTLGVNADGVWYIREPTPLYKNATDVWGEVPLNQFWVGRDETDYVWYVTGVKVGKGERVSVRVGGLEDFGRVWVDGIALVRRGGGGFREGQEWVEEDGVESEGVERFEGRERTLAVLVGSFGAQSCCGHMERFRKGILGGVEVNGIDVTKGDWYHRPGLVGEKMQYWNTSRTHEWRNPVLRDRSSAMWYRLVFARRRVEELADGVGGGDVAFAVNLGSLRRGHAWVNGRSIGRYWNVEERDREGCEVCGDRERRFEGDYSCPVKCSGGYQEWYHVPAEWALEEDGRDVEVVVFDDGEGDPYGVYLTALAN
ncbi:hypothetical protein HDU97_003363 [Phlyctochytrium planicorne]|nr:hypothetical protein HDU97_003363 [Phlyctochytrium planicorne]